jgi:hypothetical protein
MRRSSPNFKLIRDVPVTGRITAVIVTARAAGSTARRHPGPVSSARAGAAGEDAAVATPA